MLSNQNLPCPGLESILMLLFSSFQVNLFSLFPLVQLLENDWTNLDIYSWLSLKTKIIFVKFNKLEFFTNLLSLVDFLDLGDEQNQSRESNRLHWPVCCPIVPQTHLR